MKVCSCILIVEDEGKKEEHVLIVGNYPVCFATREIAKKKEKEFRKNGKIPPLAKLTYKIECHKVTRKGEQND